MLAVNARKPKRERLTRIRIFEELRARGYDGGYDAVRRYAASWSKEEEVASAAAYVPLSFDPGEAYQFDWSHEIVVIDGATTTVKVAHVRLCHSRMLFVQAYWVGLVLPIDDSGRLQPVHHRLEALHNDEGRRCDRHAGPGAASVGL